VPVPALPGTPCSRRHAARRGTTARAPAIDILAEHGYGAAEIDALLAQGTVAETPG
jgi:hypothetical protein